MSESKRGALLVATQIKDVFAATAIAAAKQERRELAAFCLLLAHIEQDGRLEELIKLIRPALNEFVSQTEPAPAAVNHTEKVKWH